MVLTFQPPFFAGLSGYIAEMGAAFLCAAHGSVPTVRHSDYIASRLLTVLREDNRAIFRAASAATKAADWLLARRPCPEQSRGGAALDGRIAA